MTEKTHAQKAIENRISQKQRVANKKFQDYSEHTDYTEYTDYTDYFDYVDYGDDINYSIFDGPLPDAKPVPCPVKKLNIFQRIFGRDSR